MPMCHDTRKIYEISMFYSQITTYNLSQAKSKYYEYKRTGNTAKLTE